MNLYLKHFKFRYAKLSKLWLNHGVPEEVTHSLEQSPGMWRIDVIMDIVIDQLHFF